MPAQMISFLSPLFYFSSLFLSKDADAQPLIRGICKISSQQDPVVNYHFCTTSLQAAYGSRHADIKDLGKISIKLTHDNLTDTMSYIIRLLENGIVKLSSYVTTRLDDCLELYSDSIINIKHAMISYKSNRYDEANILISSVMDAATTCENEFKEKQLFASLLTKRNAVTFELTAIGLSIIRILQNGIS